MELSHIHTAVLENMNAAVYIRDYEKNVLYVNPAALKVTGWSAEEVLDKKCYEIFGDERLKCKDCCPAEKAITERIHILHHEGELKTRSGDIKKMQVSISPIIDGNAAIGAVIIMEDLSHLKAVEKTNVKTLIAMEKKIAERKHAEEALRYRETFQHLICTISTSFIHLSCNQIDEKINNALQQIGEFAEADRSYVFMFSKDGSTVDNTHEWCAEGIAPEIANLKGIDLDTQLPWFAKILRRPEFFHVARTETLPPEAAAEKEHFLAQGIQSLVVVPMVCGGSLLGFVGFDSVRKTKIWPPEVVPLLKIVGEMLANTLERRKSENALRESEERLRILSQGAFEAIVILRDKKIVHANDQYYELFGYCPDELADKDVVSLTVSTRFLETVRNHIAAGDPGPYEVAGLTKKGEEIPLEIRFRQMEVEGKPAGMAAIRNLTERKRLEEQLHQARKLEAVGTLAAGIAHDFNNMLAVIQGYVSLMLYDTDPSNASYENLKIIEKQVQSGAELTRQLLGYARKGRYCVTPINLSGLIQEVASTFGRTRKDIMLEMDLHSTPCPINADQGQIAQVFLNLFVNAGEAMPNGGKLTVSTSIAARQDMENREDLLKPGPYVLATVTDTGRGIDPENLARIFEPFFTTKDMKRGVGLGLASAYGIVTGHGGCIEVDSKVGQGTTFRVYLPLTEKKVEMNPCAEKEVKTGTATVLIIDDEALVLETGVRILEKLGYRVLQAHSGAEALEQYRKFNEDIDLVILDMIMPAMSGSEVFDHMMNLNPKVKVLLSSGYSMTGKAEKLMTRGCQGFIQKPFSIKEFSEAVYAVLNLEKP